VKFVDGWYWPDGEEHMIEWMAEPKNRMRLNGRPAYQGKKQKVAMDWCGKFNGFRTAVDIGAHIGLWSYNLEPLFGAVVAFEPVAAHRECFELNVSSHVELHPVALGQKAGLVSIRSNPTSSGDSRVDGAGDIEMHRLDDYDLHNVDFIKVDLEGYEYFALRGAEETIKRWRPCIIVEQKPGFGQRFALDETDAVKYLQRLGATVRAVMSGDYILTFA